MIPVISMEKGCHYQLSTTPISLKNSMEEKIEKNIGVGRITIKGKWFGKNIKQVELSSAKLSSLS